MRLHPGLFAFRPSRSKRGSKVAMNPRLFRTLGLCACLVGALTMIAARFGGRLPPAGVWVGLTLILTGWALFALSSICRARGSNG
jgi:hypothetical protein